MNPLLLLVGLSAGSPTPTPSPVPSIALAGTWTFGEGPEPKEAIVTLRPGCYAGLTTWVLDQDGSHVSATLQVSPPVTGARPAYTTGITEKVKGDLDGSAITLTGTHQVTYSSDYPGGAFMPKDKSEDVTYSLRWNAVTKHLVGTRNGKTFWAAKAVVIPQQPCGPPPP